jgi:hypothetical protein
MASKTAAPGLYPRQIVIMVTDEVGDLIDKMATKHRVSKSEVARTLIDAGIEVGQAAAAGAELDAATTKAARLSNVVIP